MPVYQYEGVHYDLPDGLTNEQAIAKIEAHLGKTSTPQDSGSNSFVQFGKDTLGTVAGLVDTIYGVPKAAIATAAVPFAKLSHPEYNTDELRDAAGRAIEQVAPGIGSLGNIAENPGYKAVHNIASLPGEAINWAGNKIGYFTGSKEMAGASKLAADVAMFGVGIPGTKQAVKGFKKFAETVDPGLRNVKAPERGIASAEQALKAPEPTPETPAPGQGAFQNIADRLGYQEGEHSVLPERPTPMQSMADTLTKTAENERLAKAQEELYVRQRELELAVKRQQQLDFNASERARQEAASSVSEAHKAWADAQENARLAAESEKTQGMKQMEIDDTQHVLPDTNELIAPQYGVERGIGRVDENGMPIRADRTIEAQNLENPLQRNLWGDELPRQGEQEAPRGITQAIDIMDNTTQAREGGRFVKGTEQSRAVSRLSGNPPLGSARRALMKKQGGMLYLGEGKKAPVEVRQESGEYRAYVNGEYVGRLASNITPEQGRMIGEPASVDMVKVEPKARGTGVSDALYQAWAKDHDGSVAISGKTEASAMKVWKRNFPEKVEEYINQEADRIKQGAPIQQVLSNIKDPEVRQQVLERSQQIRTKGNGQSGKILFDFGDKKGVEDIANSRIESPEKAIELAGKASDVSQNLLQRGINLLTKGGTYLKAKLNNPVVSFTVDRFLNADSLARGEVNQKLHGEYLTKLRSLSKSEYEGAFRLLNAADLNQRSITPEFMQEHGLSPKLQDFITTHQRLMNDVLGKINEARAAAGKKPVTAREAYSAMSMTGDYRKVVTKNIDGVPTVVGVIGADRVKGRLGWSLEKIEKRMMELDPSLQFGPLQDITARRSSKGTPHEAFTDALKVLGEDNPHIADFLRTLREVAKSDSANYMGMQKHTMAKKGVWGMEGRKPWETEANNAAQFFENQVKYMESAYNWSHLSDAAKDVNAVLRDPSVIQKHGNAIKLSEEYMQNALGINPSQVGKAVDNLFNSIGTSTGVGPSNIRGGLSWARRQANTWMLSLNPSFLAIQLVQGPTAIPAMTALLRGRGLAPATTWLTQGMGHFVEAGTVLMKSVSKPELLSSVEKGAIEYARKHHIYATDMVEHANQTRKDAGYYWTKATQSPAALIESGTRAQVYMTFVKMMEDSGLKVKDGLYEQAHRLTDMAMNNYAGMEKPPVYNALGPLGSMAYNLRSFGHNEISRWSMMAREISKSKNPAPLLTQMATTIAIAGAMGLPFYSQWESLYDYITKKMGNPRSLTLDVMEASEQLTKELGPNWKYTLSHGMPAYLGADVSKRVGLGDVLPSKASDAAFAGGGKLADMIATTGGVIAHPDESHAKAFALAWAPPVVSSVMKEKWFTKDNKAYSMDPDKPTKATALLNDRDKFLKQWGVTGINESVQKQTDYQLKKLDKTYKDFRDTAMVNITHDLYNGEPIKQKDIDRYFIAGQGDAKTFEQQFNSVIMGLNLTPNQLAILQDSVSKSVTRVRSLQRRVEAQ